jgi:hypothetical protein
MKHFALISAAGYIAPRHMKAIEEMCNDLVGRAQYRHNRTETPERNAASKKLAGFKW